VCNDGHCSASMDNTLTEYQRAEVIA
jgi:hypothetical protein